MAQVVAGSLGWVEQSAAQGGVSLSTTAAYQALKTGTKNVSLLAWNVSAATVYAKLLFCPYLVIIKTTDALAAAANATDYSDEAQDPDTTTVVNLDDMDTAANNDYLYVGSDQQFRGVYIDVGAVNGNASVLTVNYWDGTAWSDISDTDGTASGGASIAQDGNVTWTIPSDWTKDDLVSIGDATSAHSEHLNTDLFWTRWQWSAALDAEVEIDTMLGLYKNTNYINLVDKVGIELDWRKGVGGYGGIEALTSAGTANLIVNQHTASRSSQFGV